ncbi:hypothetical protein [Chamaesiphon sp. OTE_75_metabat_556]|nr:hypothetical protein [Chamaesiphon sp. OTE_75_metabat_556]
MCSKCRDLITSDDRDPDLATFAKANRNLSDEQLDRSEQSLLRLVARSH